MKNNRNKPWTAIHSQTAQSMQQMGLDAASIALELGRTSDGVKVHLSKLKNNYVRPKVKPALKSVSHVAFKKRNNKVDKSVLLPTINFVVTKAVVMSFMTSIAGGALGVWIALNLMVMS
jgi:hypothetical protein